VQTWSLAGNQVIAAADQLSQAAQNAGQAGNTADPGGLDPNDPWDKFNRLLGQGKSEIDAAVEASTQGSGDRFVIGPYNTPTGTLNYIKEAINAGGKYFDAESKLWNQLEQKGLAGQVNRQVIYEQMKTGIGRIELSSGLTIDTVLQTMKESWTAQEVVWIEELAQRFGYVRNMTNTGWMKTP
jgi:hypothetical protein